MSPQADRRPPTPSIDVQFDRPDRRHDTGGPLSIRYRVEGCDGERVRAIEHSVLWYTEGKGEEDLGVHFFQRLSDPDAIPPTPIAGAFATLLPRSPLSYEGFIVKVRWCIRIRIFFEGSRDFVSEHVFSVGGIPPARLPLPRA